MKICGIDEAGRGPLAGPLHIAGCILNKQIDGLKDSKKLSEKRREILYEEIIKNSTYKIVKFSAAQIDKFGLSKCLKLGLNELVDFFAPFEVKIIFDGNSKFGAEGFETMVKADDKIKEVSAASILAKVSRDRVMRNFDIKFPFYDFAKNKGYGSKAHIEAIQKYGYCEIHRKSFHLKHLQGILKF